MSLGRFVSHSEKKTSCWNHFNYIISKSNIIWGKIRVDEKTTIVVSNNQEYYLYIPADANVKREIICEGNWNFCVCIDHLNEFTYGKPPKPHKMIPVVPLKLIWLYLQELMFTRSIDEENFNSVKNKHHWVKNESRYDLKTLEDRLPSDLKARTFYESLIPFADLMFDSEIIEPQPEQKGEQGPPRINDIKLVNGIFVFPKKDARSDLKQNPEEVAVKSSFDKFGFFKTLNEEKQTVESDLTSVKRKDERARKFLASALKLLKDCGINDYQEQDALVYTLGEILKDKSENTKDQDESWGDEMMNDDERLAKEKEKPSTYLTALTKQ